MKFFYQGKQLPLWLTFGMRVHTGDRDLLTLVVIGYVGLIASILAGAITVWRA